MSEKTAMIDRDGNELSNDEAFKQVVEFKMQFFDWIVKEDMDTRIMLAGICEILPIMLLTSLEADKALNTIDQLKEYMLEITEDDDSMHRLMMQGVEGTA